MEELVQAGKDLKNNDAHQILNDVRAFVDGGDRLHLWSLSLQWTFPEISFIEMKQISMNPELEREIENGVHDMLDRIVTTSVPRMKSHMKGVLCAYAGFTKQQLSRGQPAFLPDFLGVTFTLLQVFQGTQVNAFNYLVGIYQKILPYVLVDADINPVEKYFFKACTQLFPKLFHSFDQHNISGTNLVLSWLRGLFTSCGMEYDVLLVVWDVCFVFGVQGSIFTVFTLLHFLNECIISSKRKLNESELRNLIASCVADLTIVEFYNIFQNILGDAEIRQTLKYPEFKVFRKLVRIAKKSVKRVKASKLPVVLDEPQESSIYQSEWEELRKELIDVSIVQDWLECTDEISGISYFAHVSDPLNKWTWEVPKCGYIMKSGALLLPCSKSK